MKNFKAVQLKIKILILFVFLSYVSISQEITGVTHIKSDINKTIKVSGNLSDGAIIGDLSWAWNSSVACFSEAQKHYFTGNHVLYSTNLPAFSEMEIKLIPTDADANFSLYAYTISPVNSYIVPNLPSCVTCKTVHKWDKTKANSTQDYTRIITGLVSSENSFRVIIGVVGAENLTQGAFVLEIMIKKQ